MRRRLSLLLRALVDDSRGAEGVADGVCLCRVRQRRRRRGLEDVLLVGVDGLNVLAQVVETRKLAVAVAAKGPLASVFANVSRKVFRPREGHSAVAKVLAPEDFWVLFGLFGGCDGAVHRESCWRRCGRFGGEENRVGEVDNGRSDDEGTNKKEKEKKRRREERKR